MNMSQGQSAIRSRLSATKLALLEKRLGRAFLDDAGSRIPKRPQPDRAPLSFQQQRQWVLLEKEGRPSFYNNVARLTGRLDVDALCRAFDEIVKRHEILRTTFSIENGYPIQVVHPPRPGNMVVKDLAGLPLDEREQRVAQLNAAQVRPFDLKYDRPFRAVLLRLQDEEHLFLFTLLHLVADRWSIKVLISEMASCYRAFSEQDEALLPKLPIQYGDYAWWQQQSEAQSRLSEELVYWRTQLNGYGSILPLPTDKPRPPLQTFRGAHESLVLTREISESLKSLSQREGTTVFMSMLAVFKILLARLTGCTDIAVATGVAGRQQVETQGLIGCFINTLVMRTKLDGDPTFTDLLQRVREVSLGAYAHQETPFQKLVEELCPLPNPAYPPLVQVSFALHNAVREEESSGDPRISVSAVDPGRAPFDLTLRIQETAEGMICTMEYNLDLFQRATAAKMLEDYRRLVSQVVHHAECRLSELIAAV